MLRVTSRTIKHAFRATNIRYSSSEQLKKTCLYDLHLAHNAKMVPFAGYSMPVVYQDQTLVQSHLHTRSKASIFDVSHMVQSKIFGADRIEFMEGLCVCDVQGLKEGTGSLTVFTNDQGGILDDLIVTKTNDNFLYVVSNAACAEQDIALMQSKANQMRQQGKDIHVEISDDGLIALQGPSMTRILQPGLIDVDLSSMPFMASKVTTLFGVEDVRITRCGYTGEDGVEISIPASRTAEITDRLLSSSSSSAPPGECRLAGLGARDTLRLEAGLCLYGNDLDPTTSPVQAGLLWTVGKRRRAEADFPGAQVILKQIADKPNIRRVGFVSKGAPIRRGTEIFKVGEQEPIGHVTSGCPSPVLRGQNISMGYVKRETSKAGTQIEFEVRKKRIEGKITKMPFVPSNYFISS